MALEPVHLYAGENMSRCGVPVGDPCAACGSRLSAREIEVLRVLIAGDGALVAAHELGISVQTVKNHLTSAYAKLGVGSLVGAYHALGWLFPRD